MEPFAGPGKTDRSLSCEGGRSQTWIARVKLFFTQRLDNGSRTRGPQITSLLLYPLSYIRMDAEGSDYRRHTVLQRSRTSEAVRTSAISDYRSFTSSFIRIIRAGVVVKKNFVNVTEILPPVAHALATL